MNWYRQLFAKNAIEDNDEWGYNSTTLEEPISEFPKVNDKQFHDAHYADGAKMWAWSPQTGLEVDSGFYTNHSGINRWRNERTYPYRGRYDPVSNTILLYKKNDYIPDDFPNAMIEKLKQAFPGSNMAVF